MNPVLYLWMYESWIQDLIEEHKFSKNYAILTGSFSNMELAQKMIDAETPDYESTEVDFEETLKMIEESVQQEQPIYRKRRHRQGVIK